MTIPNNTDETADVIQPDTPLHHRNNSNRDAITSSSSLSWMSPEHAFQSPMVSSSFRRVHGNGISNEHEDETFTNAAAIRAAATWGKKGPHPTPLLSPKLSSPSPIGPGTATGLLSSTKPDRRTAGSLEGARLPPPRRLLDTTASSSNYHQQHPTLSKRTAATPRRQVNGEALQDTNGNGFHPLTPCNSGSPTDDITTTSPGSSTGMGTTWSTNFVTPDQHLHSIRAHPESATSSTPRFSSLATPSSSRRMMSPSPTNHYSSSNSSHRYSCWLCRIKQIMSLRCKTRQRRLRGIIVTILSVSCIAYAYFVGSMLLQINTETTSIDNQKMSNVYRDGTSTVVNPADFTNSEPHNIRVTAPHSRDSNSEVHERPVSSSNQDRTQRHTQPQREVQKGVEEIFNSPATMQDDKMMVTSERQPQPRIVHLLDLDKYNTASNDIGKGNKLLSKGGGSNSSTFHFELDFLDDPNPQALQRVGQDLSSDATPAKLEDDTLQSDQQNNTNNAISKNHQPKISEVEQDECIPLGKWQTSSFLNCNTLHEIDLIAGTTKSHYSIRKGVAPNDNNTAEDEEESAQTSPIELTLLGQGWFRSTWKVGTVISVQEEESGDESDEYAVEKEEFVLKMLRTEREFLPEYYDLHRRDAVAMERLTSSEFVMDVYGYCGQSALNELANFKNGDVTSLEALSKRLRGHDGEPSVQWIKLRMATSIALGVAQVHEVNLPFSEDDPSPSSTENQVNTKSGRPPHEYLPAMVHYDLNPRNIALVEGGKPKLNDFNIAEFLRYNPRTNQTCGFPSRLHEPWWRAPEEMNTNHTNGMTMLNEKVDVYALGNVLFHILTTHSPRGKMKKERMAEVRNLVRQGIPPVLPESILKLRKRDPIVAVFLKAMDLCLVKDPDKRGTAREVADLLFETTMKIQNERERHRNKRQFNHHNRKDH